MKNQLLVVLAFVLPGATALAQSCASNAYISNGANCISLSWFPQSTAPATLPASIDFNNSTYVLSHGLGDIAFPAVYKIVSGDPCELPSDFVNGDVAIHFGEATISCRYPGGTVLALQDIVLYASQKNGQRVLEWMVDNKGIDRFLVESSTNGKDFYALAAVAPKLAGGKTTYHFTDLTNSGTYYRVKVYENGSQTYYSKIVLAAVQMAVKSPVFPSPNHGSFVIAGVASDAIATVKIHDAQGRSLPFSSQAYDAGRQELRVNIPGAKPGLLLISFTKNGQTACVKTIVE